MQLLVDFRVGIHGSAHFSAQYFPITGSKASDVTAQRGFRYFQSMCQLGVSWWGLSAACKKDFQFIEQHLLGVTFVLSAEPFQANRDQGFRPTAIKELRCIAYATVSLKKRLCIVDLLFVQRQKTLSTPALQRSFSVGSVYEEVFGRGEQKPTEPAFLPIDAPVDFVLDQVGEKALRKILGVMHGVSSAAHETVKRCPINLAKLPKRGVCHLWLSQASSRGENHAPLG